MIVRPDRGELITIRQADHARLALALLDGWRPGGLPSHPRCAAIRLATREHDNGWIEEDAAPQVDANGRPIDFVAADLALKMRVWTRGVDRVAAGDRYAAALIAQHALTVYDQRRSEPAWAAFFEALSARRSSLLTAAGLTAADADTDYAFLNLADALSLAFCTGLQPPRPIAGHAVALADTTLTVTPDAFGGTPVPLHVPARRIPDRAYASAADLRAALDAADPTWLAGLAR